jgi:hypothetical protein
MACCFIRDELGGGFLEDCNTAQPLTVRLFISLADALRCFLGIGLHVQFSCLIVNAMTWIWTVFSNICFYLFSLKF